MLSLIESNILKCFAVGLVVSVLLSSAVQAQDLKEGIQAHKQGNYKIALKKLRPLANQGNPQAQLRLANMYARGKAVEKNKMKTIRLAAKSAEQGYPKAQRVLGEMFLEGQFVPENKKVALKWLRKAALQGELHASYKLGALYKRGLDVTQDYDKAIKWLEMAANQGYGLAANEIANIYNPRISLFKSESLVDDKKSVKWYGISYVLSDGSLKQESKEKINTLSKNMSAERFDDAVDQTERWLNKYNE